MKQTIFLLNFLVLIIGSGSLSAQTDTIFYDVKWQPTQKAKAAFFRPSPQEEGNGFRVKDYYISGKLQMEAFSESIEEDKFHGEAAWYYESGEVQQKAQYVHGLMQGTLTVYAKDGAKLSEGTYENGTAVEGTYMNMGSGYYYLITYQNGLPVREEMFSTDEKNKTRAVYEYAGNELSSVVYYDQKGNLIGKSNEMQNGYIHNGQYVDFYYDPLAPKSIVEYKDGAVQNPQKYFYSTGEMQKEIYTKGYDYEKEVCYDKTGKQLGVLTYDGYSPYDGVQYLFIDDSDMISSITPYANGKIDGEHIKYHDNGQVAEKTPYVKGYREGNAQFYNKEGKLLHEGTYKNDYPYEGTFNGFYATEVITYSAGKRVAEKSFYSNGAIQKDHIIGKENVMYDSLGQEIARLTYRDGYPYEGKLIEMYNDLISSISIYKKGMMASSQYFENGLPYETTVYNKDYGYDKKITYYTNGQVKKETFYEEYYAKEEKTYDKTGKLLGTFHAQPVKSGKEVIFSNDIIQKINEYKAGALMNEAKFNAKGQPLYSIVSEGESTFYDKKGNFLSKAIYKEGLPYEGTVYKYDDYTANIKEKTIYKEGLQNGEQQIYVEAYYDQEPVLSQTYTFDMGIKEGPATKYMQGKILEITIYKNGLLDGEAKFYNEDGVQHSTAYYRDGEPFEGIFYGYDYAGAISEIKSYVNGEPDGLWEYYDYRGKYREESYKEGSLLENRDYEDGEIKARVTYKDNLPYEGTSLSYNSISHYLDGKVIKTSEYSDGTHKALVVEREFQQDGLYTETVFYEDGKKKSIVNYKSNHDYYNQTRHGDALFYSKEGKKIASGVYEEGVPVKGNFIYYHYSNDKNFIQLNIAKGRYVADFYEEGTHVYTIEGRQGKAAKIEGKKYAENFIAMLSSNGEYLIK